MVLTTYTPATDVAAIPSPGIWANSPYEFVRGGGAVHDVPGIQQARLFEDDFSRFRTVPVSAGATTVGANGWEVYMDIGPSLAPDPDAGNGPAALEVLLNDADNDEVVISGPAPLFEISDDGTEEAELWFECRWKKASVADDALAAFMGLGWDNGTAGHIARTLCLTDDDGNLGAFSYIGFHVDQADGDSLDFVYKAEGQSQTVAIPGVQALAADTWYKLGFHYNPDADDAEKIAVYVDGVKQTTFVTATNIAAATFPDSERLAPLWATKVGSAAAVATHLDWIRCLQLGVAGSE